MKTPQQTEVLIVGGGAAGLATTASIRKRRPQLNVCVVEPSDTHYYQPGWTMVGGGIFKSKQTARPTRSLIPAGVTWVRDAVVQFDPSNNKVVLTNGNSIHYQVLVVATGLLLDWDAIPGLRESLGQHGVTSNYDIKTAPYTWQLATTLRKGTAIFTQAPMPIKCAGAPQKAMYLSASHWLASGALDKIQIEFHTAGAALFSVQEYVPALMEYVNKYHAALHFSSRLVAVDGPGHSATFVNTAADGTTTQETRNFDMLHVCPPQRAVDVVANSPLAAADGWLDVDPATLQHKTFANVFATGDIGNMPNAKTAAAARKQAPIAAENLIAWIDGRPLPAQYDGYGSCPLTVAHGKIVLAEFGYGGKLLPTFPTWLINGTRPSSLAWRLKAQLLPHLYWHGMLRGREWLCKPAGARSA